MSNVRLIARLDVKAPDLIKGVHLEGWRKLGNPAEFAKKYYRQGIDEIIYLDAVASLYRRNTLIDLVRETAKDVFIPITVGVELDRPKTPMPCCGPARTKSPSTRQPPSDLN